MKINANEMLFTNKNLKLRDDQAGQASAPVAVMDAPEGEDAISALNAQAMNNIAFQGVNLRPIRKIGISSMAALTLLSSTMTSCEVIEPQPVNNTTVYDNTQVNINLSVTIYMTDEEVIALILEKFDELIDSNHRQEDINQAVLRELIKLGFSMDRILGMLTEIHLSVQDIFAFIKEDASKKDEYLSKMSNDNDEIKAKLESLYQSVENGNTLSAQQNQTLTAAVAALNKGNKNDEILISLVMKAITLVNESVQNQKEMKKEVAQLFLILFSKLDKMDDSMKKGLFAIINKIDNLSNETITLLTNIFNAIEENSEKDDETNKILFAIYNKVQESIDSNKEIGKKHTFLMNVIIAKLDSMDKTFKTGVLSIINKLDKISEENIDMLTKIFNAIQENSEKDEETNKILSLIFNIVKEDVDNDKKMRAEIRQYLNLIVGCIAKLDKDMKASTFAIINHIDKASDANIKMLIKLFNKINSLDTDKTDEETKQILYAILAKLQEDIDNDKEMNAQNQALMLTIIDKLDSMDKGLKSGFMAVIKNMDKMSAQYTSLTNQVMASIDKLDRNAQMGLGMLIHQMAINNAIDEKTLRKIEELIKKLDRAHKDDVNYYNRAISLLSELLSKADKLGAKSDAILDAITNISFDANVDLSTIENTLKDILAQSKANGDTLMTIEGNTNLIYITVEGIKTAVENMPQYDDSNVVARLDAILDKMPEGCNCSVKLDVIIEKLNQLIESLKNGDNKHEGILDDLDKFFD